jgi:O-antigen ligase
VACFGHPFFHFEAGPVPLTLDRAMLVLLVAAYFFHRHLGRTDPKPLGPADVLLAAFVGLLVISGTAVGWAGTPTEPWVTLFRLIVGYLTPCVLYWIVRQSVLGRRQVSQVHGLLTALGVYLGVTGILEITKQWWAVFPPHIADPRIGIHFGRARGPMVHAVSYGLYVNVCWLAAWLYGWRFGPRGRLVLLAISPLILAGAVLTFTRSVWIGTALAGMIVIALTFPARWRVVVLGGMLAAGLTLAVTRLDSLATMQREDSAEDSLKSVSMRGSFAYVSWKMFLDRPLLGFGFGQFYTAKLDYLDDRSTSLPLEQIRGFVHHNTFLSLLTETGLVGLALYLALLTLWARDAWRLARNPGLPDWARAQGVLMLGALGTYVPLAMFHELSYTSLENSLVFLLAGLTVGLAKDEELATKNES